MPRLNEIAETRDIVPNLHIMLHLGSVGLADGVYWGGHIIIILLSSLRVLISANAIFAEEYRVEVFAHAVFDTFQVSLFHSRI